MARRFPCPPLAATRAAEPPGAGARPCPGARGDTSPRGHQMAPGNRQPPASPGAPPALRLGLLGNTGRAGGKPPLIRGFVTAAGLELNLVTLPFAKCSPKLPWFLRLLPLLFSTLLCFVPLYPNQCSRGRGTSGGHRVTSSREENCVSHRRPVQQWCLALTWRSLPGKFPTALMWRIQEVCVRVFRHTHVNSPFLGYLACYFFLN